MFINEVMLAPVITKEMPIMLAPVITKEMPIPCTPLSIHP
jgi:hypothetical protein